MYVSSSNAAIYKFCSHQDEAIDSLNAMSQSINSHKLTECNSCICYNYVTSVKITLQGALY